MADTAIEWTDTVWNPSTGCDKVSAGCDHHCYALTMAKRLKGMGQAKYQNDGDPRTSGPGFGLTVHSDVLDLPLRWRKPRRVFVNSMSDLFHKDVPDEFIARAWQTMAATPQHTYQILTKRPARMRAWLRRCAPWDGYVTHNGQPTGAYNDNADKGIIVGYLPSTVTKHYSARSKGGARSETRQVGSWPLANVWLGVSVEDQKRADLRIPALLSTPAAVRWLSCEPLLGPINLGAWLNTPLVCGCGGEPGGAAFGCSAECMQPERSPLDWIVIGGESGPGARVMEEEWALRLVRQCKATRVPVFVKQMGSVWAKTYGGAGKGGDWDEWRSVLRVRQYPAVADA